VGRLENKAAMVIGAGSGLGRAVAVEFAGEGARTAVVSRTPAHVDQVVAEIEAAGGQAVGAVCDVADRWALVGAVALVAERLGGIDVLVNAAQGHGTRARPGLPTERRLEELLPEEWDYQLLTGVTATFTAMQAAFPHLARSRGSVVNFASRDGELGTPGLGAFNASKEAVRALTRTAAREWGRHGITVNVIDPRALSDTMQALLDQHPGRQEWIEDQIPMGRLGDPREVARVAVFLASEDARVLTGHTVVADGGWVMTP